MQVICEPGKLLELNTISTLDSKDHHALFFDFSEKNYCDYYYKKINTFQKFTAPMMELYIGNIKLTLPLHWRILCVDRISGDLCVANVEDFLHYKMDAFLFNPEYDIKFDHAEIRVANILTNEITTFAPKIQAKNLLVIPLDDEKSIIKLNEERVSYHSCIYVTDNVDNMKNLSHISQFFEEEYLDK